MSGRIRLLALSTALLAKTAGAAPAQEVGLPLGSVPDAVVVQDLDGDPVDLGTVIGEKPVLLEFWATWCPLCEALEPRLHAVRTQYGDELEILVVAVAVNQSPRRIRRHLERHPPPGRVLYDARGAATRAFAAPSTSYVVILDRHGSVVYTGIGEDQDLETAVRRAFTR